MATYNGTEEKTWYTAPDPEKARVKLIRAQDGHRMASVDLDNPAPSELVQGDQVHTDRGRKFEITDAKVSLALGVPVRACGNPVA